MLSPLLAFGLAFAKSGFQWLCFAVAGANVVAFGGSPTVESAAAARKDRIEMIPEVAMARKRGGP